MKKVALFLLSIIIIFSVGRTFAAGTTQNNFPVAKPGLKLIYILNQNNPPASVVRKIELNVGALEKIDGKEYQWLQLKNTKVNKKIFAVWLLVSGYPSVDVKSAQKMTARYILENSSIATIEFNDTNGGVVLPNNGVWQYLLPRNKQSETPLKSAVKAEKSVKYLGLSYKLEKQQQGKVPSPPATTRIISLTPDLLIGVPHNKKIKNEKRRYDESDYEYVPLTKKNYFEMIENGINVFYVNPEQAQWIKNENVYYWGIGGKDINYPESLYRSNYVGPAIFFDEPMVHTRDYALKPKFKENPALRKSITPTGYFEAFKKEFYKAKYEGYPASLIKGLTARKDVDLGEMNFLQQNIYSWETMPSSALYQLSEGKGKTPYAMVFETPGRFGARRVLPELDMSFNCQILVDDPKNLIDMINAFLRGAARETDKEWGISIYGQVMRSEAFWYMTHAYDLGATLFFFWDNYRLAAVPYNEYLALAKNLREHAKNFPNRNLKILKHSAEVALIIPPGYNLGHVKMGIGNIGGLPELNMERTNKKGVKYRDIMSNFYIEVERCIRLGIQYDAYWNLPGLNLKGYREIVTIREDGKVEIEENGKTKILNSGRMPQRPGGVLPQLSVNVKTGNAKAPCAVTAVAEVAEGSAPLYYTQGAGKDGVYRNTYVLWELYGSQEEDYTDFWSDRWNVKVTEKDKSAVVTIKFSIEKAGNYRLKVSTCDLAGRTKVVWKDIKIVK